MAGEEADESSCKAIALYADVEVAERKGAVAMVEETVLKMTEVNVVVVRLSCSWSCRCTRGAMVMTKTRRGSRRGRGRCQSRRNQGHRRCTRKATNQGRRGRNGRVDAEVDAAKPPECRGAAGLVRSSNASRTKAHVDVANTQRTRERAPTMWLCWTKKKQCGRRRVGE